MKKPIFILLAVVFSASFAFSADIAPNYSRFSAVVNSGVVDGGCVYTYETGTTTKLDTYTDSTGAVANTNPVVLDTDGQADIWLASGVEYRFVITDSDCDASSPLDTVDKIVGIANLAVSGLTNHAADANAHSGCTEVTIAGDTLDLAAYEEGINCFEVSAEAGTSDFLDTLLGYSAGDFIHLYPADGDTITIVDGSLIRAQGVNFEMSSQYDRWQGQFHSGTIVTEVGRYKDD
jgi:hypothetical protein